MASPVNSQLKYFVCFLILAIFSFFLMFCFSPKTNVHKIYDMKLTSPRFFGAAKDTENCVGQGPECHREYVVRDDRLMSENKLVLSNEFSSVESLNETLSDTIPIQETAATRNVEIIINNTYNKDWWNAMLKKQTERKLHLRRMCETKYNQTILPLTEFVKDNKRLYSFYYVDKFKLMYSFVHKVGSSNWARTLKTVTQSNNLKRLYRLSPGEALWRLQNYTSFIVVRHPLVRLLSAYKDKFVQHHIPHFKSIGRQILKTYRKGVTTAELQRADDVQFEEFLRYLVANKKNRGNTHWDQLIIRNRVCLFDYDIIAKLETGDDDTNFILKTFNMEGLVHLAPHYTNYTGKQDIIRSFYSTIPESLLQSVVYTYESDFILFNYSMNAP